MQLDFYTYPGRRIGSARVEGGMARFDDAIVNYAVTAYEPDTHEQLDAHDGERYLRALVHEFRTGYVWAVVVEDGTLTGTWRFHLPGKHSQKRHGHRSKAGVMSRKDETTGEWKPVDSGASTRGGGSVRERFPLRRETMNPDKIGAIDDALTMIDDVHAVGPMRDVAITGALDSAANGTYSHERGTIGLDDAKYVPDDDLALTTIHEIGHALDYNMFGDGYPMGASWEADSPVAGVMRAINASATTRGMHKELVALNASPESFPMGVDWARDFTRQLNYQLAERELIARAYTQYVATKSKSKPSISATYRKRQDKYAGYGEKALASDFAWDQDVPSVGSPVWGDDEFAPISDAFDTLFAQQGTT